MSSRAKPRLRAVIAALAMALLAMNLAMAAKKETPSFLVRSWQSEDGLPSNVVRALAQTADGYLWVATAEGVTRFDGTRFSSFAREEQAVLAQRPPRALFPMPEGDLWITTSRGGLLHADPRGALREVWPDVDPLVGPAIVDIITVASDGRGGALIRRGKDFYGSRNGASPQVISATEEIEAALQRATEAYTRRSSTAPSGAQLELTDRHERNWVAAPGQGLSVTAPGADRTIKLLEFGPDVPVTTLLEGQEGNIWIGTGGNGLFQARVRRVEVFSVGNGLKDRTVFAVLEDRSGALWAANKSGGIDRITNNGVRHYEMGEGGANRPISALCEDREGRLWAAARNGAVYQLEGDSFRLMTGTGLAISKVLAIVMDPRGRLWFGGPQGIAMLEGRAVRRFAVEQGLQSPSVTALTSGPDGMIWAGSANGAIQRGGESGFSAVGNAGSRAVSAILPDSDGTVWITTLGAGLFRWKDNQMTRYADEEGLPELRLTSALSDDSDNLWLGSLSGILRISKAQLAEIASGRRERGDWLLLDRSDGMLSRECTGAFQPAGWRRRDGALVFPTVNGIASIQAERLELNTIPPPIVIEEARANGRAANHEGAEIEAGPGRSRLEFRYAALSFTSPQKTRFRVLLEGLDGSDWLDMGTQRTVAFESTPPGRYRFRVQAANGDGVWNHAGLALAIKVRPHVWETKWFRGTMIALVSAVAIALGWIIARIRMRGRLMRLEMQTLRERERARIAQDLHDDLGASLTEISMLAHLAAEEDKRSRDPLPEIATKAQHLVEALDEIVWAVNPRHDTVVSLADYLSGFAAEFLESAGIALRLDIPRNLPALPLDAEQRHSVFLTAREALNNAVKHSGAKEVRLQARVTDGTLHVVVEDNGRGLTAETSAFSEGLRSMRERLAASGGSCRIESPGCGTRVEMMLPLRAPQ